MSMFKLPFTLCKELGAMMARFWWDLSEEKKKRISWKNGENICKPKYGGGLEFRDLFLFNQALLAKQAWHIINNLNSLASLVIKGKYCIETPFF